MASDPVQPDALEGHFAELYRELRALAAQRLAKLPPGQTLQPTALVHETYLRLVANSQLDWSDRRAFFSLAARSMRWILVDQARRKLAGKRRHVLETRTAGELAADSAPDLSEIMSLDEALSRLSSQDGRKAEVVMLRYFVGLSIEETAEVLECSPATVKREWNFARAWLLRDMRGSADERGEGTG